MHGNAGIDKLTDRRPQPCFGYVRHSDNHVSGARTVDELVEAIDGTQYRDRVRFWMEGQMAAPRAQLRGSAMAGVDEADDLWSAPGSLAQPPRQSACSAPRPDQNDAVSTE